MSTLSRPSPTLTRVALAAVFCAALPAAARTHKPPLSVPRESSEASSSTPRLVVTIVVDQLSAWVASERLPLLPRTGGFARLLREGTYVRDLRYAHAITETAPGHAALYTGTTPRQSGVWGNEMPPAPGCDPPPDLGPIIKVRQSVLVDPAEKLITVEGKDETPGHCGTSLKLLLVETLADRLIAEHPDTRVISLSFKDRGAMFGGGRKPTASVWFDAPRGHFVTSTALATTLPAWITATDQWLNKLLGSGSQWTPEDPAWVAAHAGTVDDAPGEGGDYGGDAARKYPGIGVTFPHFISSPKAFRASPLADEALFRAAIAAIDSTDVKDHHALLALSLSANDSIGHVFGPDSWEAWDELHRLDTSLGAFLDDLDNRYGARNERGGYAIVLSADHGDIHMPEACTSPAVDRWMRPCKDDGHRIGIDPMQVSPTTQAQHLVDFVGTLQRIAVDAGGRRAWIAGIIDPYVYLDKEASRDDNRARLLARLAKEKIPGVKRFYDVLAAPATCPPISDESEDALLCRGVHPGSGGALYVVPFTGSFFDTNYSRGHGGGHGTPYLFDRSVPLIVRAPERVKHAVIEEPMPFSTFTHTAASLLGISPPVAARDAPDLTSR